MNILMTFLLAVQLLAALVMIGLILVQHGKGADAGAAFGGGGGGGSASLFGASGGANFMSRSTAVLATIFLSTTLALAYLSSERPEGAGSVLEAQPAPTAADSVPAPAVPVPQPSVPAGAQQIPGQ